MTRQRLIDGACPPLPRLALVIADIGFRSRLTADLILAGADVVVAPSLEDIGDTMVAVTDDRRVRRPPTGHHGVSRLAICTVTRDSAGGTRIEQWTPIACARAIDVMRAARHIDAN